MRRHLFAALLGLTGVMELALVQAQGSQAPPVRQITPVKNGLYKASNGNWHTVFLVTSAGILLVDPISTPFANWLEGQLAERFPGVPVRYVVYSHSHWDHVEGGEVFADTARFVAHENVLRNLDGRLPHMPGGFVDLDDNGRFERAEVRDRPSLPSYGGVCGSNFFNRLDLDRDGHVTSTEYHSEIRRPDVVYSERMRISLGDSIIELVHPGKNHANDGTVVLFVNERVAFSTDFPADALVTDSLRSLPSACGHFDGHPIAEWIRSYRSIEALDFDLLVQAHGTATYSRQDVAEARGFFEDLAAAVSQGMAQGRSLAELKETLLLEKYRDWRNYERLRRDVIEAAYFNLKTHR